MLISKNKFVYWIAKSDVQKRAKEKIGRKLRQKELKLVADAIDSQLTPELDAIISEAVERALLIGGENHGSIPIS